MRGYRLGTLFAVLLCAVAVNNVYGEDKPEAAAQKQAEAWLALVDAGKYPESWEAAATAFKSQMSKERWSEMAKQVREPLGRVQSRKLASAQYAKELPNAPAGEYVVIQFNTSFEHKHSAVETIVPMRDRDGEWRVSGYFIK